MMSDTMSYCSREKRVNQMKGERGRRAGRERESYVEKSTERERQRQRMQMDQCADDSERVDSKYESYCKRCDKRNILHYDAIYNLWSERASNFITYKHI